MHDRGALRWPGWVVLPGRLYRQDLAICYLSLDMRRRHVLLTLMAPLRSVLIGVFRLHKLVFQHRQLRQWDRDGSLLVVLCRPCFLVLLRRYHLPDERPIILGARFRSGQRSSKRHFPCDYDVSDHRNICNNIFRVHRISVRYVLIIDFRHKRKRKLNCIDAPCLIRPWHHSRRCYWSAVGRASRRSPRLPLLARAAQETQQKGRERAIERG